MPSEYTLVFVKPHAVRGSRAFEILSELERDKDLCPVYCSLVILTEEQVRAHYEEHKDKDFYESLVKSLVGEPILVAVFAGFDAVWKVRNLIGRTDPKQAIRTTIRWKYGNHNNIQENAIHASDSAESAQREISILIPEHKTIIAPFRRRLMRTH